MMLSRNPDGSIGVMATLQVDALISWCDGNIRRHGTQCSSHGTQRRTTAQKYDIDEYGRATGLMTWMSERIDIQPAYARIASRTHQCTTKDWMQ
jgi:hypothetical protein